MEMMEVQARLMTTFSTALRDRDQLFIGSGSFLVIAQDDR
jgi:hypothetical protein